MANINQEIDTIRVGGTDYEVSDPHALYGEHDESAPDLVDVPLYESDLVTQVTDDSTKPSAANVPYALKQQIDQVSSDLTPQSFTLTIDTAHFSMPSYRAIKMGKFVEIAGDIAVTDNSYKTSNNFSQCFNIPEVSKAPSVATVFNIIDTTNDKPLNGTITTDGKVYVNRDYTTSCSSLRFHALYIVS